MKMRISGVGDTVERIRKWHRREELESVWGRYQ